MKVKSTQFIYGLKARRVIAQNSLNKGLGTEALALWIDYLFDNSEVHKVGLHTYSFNSRMNKVAEKLGFVKEGLDREVVCWNGKWINRIRYGLLLEEWRKKD